MRRRCHGGIALTSLIVLLLGSNAVVLAKPPPEIQAMAKQIVTKVAMDSDAEFFAAWNLDWPGMESVKVAVESDNHDRAKAALKDYFPELKRADDFRRFGVRGMELAAEDEFYPDGMSMGRCPGYHGGSRGAIQRLIESAALMGTKCPIHWTSRCKTLRSTFRTRPFLT